MPPTTAPDARWDCNACGFCCRFHQLGPVEPAIVEGLRARKVGDDWAPAADGWIEERDNRYFLRRVDAACVFLRPDNLCAIHALYGAEAKPGFCRDFPLVLSDGPEGERLVIRPDCASVHRGRTEGRPLVEHAARLPLGRRKALSTVAITPERSVPGSTFGRLEERGLVAIAAAENPSAAIASLRALLDPEAGDSDPDRCRLAIRAVAEALRIFIERSPEAPTAPEAAFTAQLHAAVVAVRDWEQQPPALTEPGSAYLQFVLQNEWLGRQWFETGSVAAGLGEHLVGTWVARFGSGSGRDDALGPAYAQWSRFARNHHVRGLLRAAQPAVLDAFRFA